MIYSILNWAFQIYSMVIFIYVIMSWLPNVRESAVGLLFQKLSEPYLSVFRRIIPPIGMIDLSPLVALFALQFVKAGLFTVLSWVL